MSDFEGYSLEELLHQVARCGGEPGFGCGHKFAYSELWPAITLCCGRFLEGNYCASCTADAEMRNCIFGCTDALNELDDQEDE